MIRIHKALSLKSDLYQALKGMTTAYVFRTVKTLQKRFAPYGVAGLSIRGKGRVQKIEIRQVMMVHSVLTMMITITSTVLMVKVGWILGYGVVPSLGHFLMQMKMLSQLLDG